MANTYTKIYIHIVFAVRGRRNLIPKQHRERLQQYMTGIAQERDQKMLAIYCMPDHTHILIGFRPATSLSDLVRDIKAISSKFINENNWINGKFNWQEGYGAFSYSRSQIGMVASYIENQEEHHRNKSFKEEYLKMLKDFEVDYEEQYLFDWIE